MSKQLIILLIFSLLTSFSICSEVKSYFYKDFINEEIKGKEVNKNMTYNISYEKGDIKNNYIKLIIDSNDYLNIYYSPISPQREYAYLLNSGKGKMYLYINKAFTKSEARGVIYLSIECYISQCSFNLSSTEVEYIDLERNSFYSYFTTNKKNLINTFYIKAKEKNGNDDHITFWASGNKNIQMNIKYINNNNEIKINSKYFDNGKYAKFKETDIDINNDENNLNQYYIIEVTAPANNLITFGTTVNEYTSGVNRLNTYIVNSKEIYGVLSKEKTIQCFNIEGTKNNSALSVQDFNRNIELKIMNNQGNIESKKEIKNGNLLFIIEEKYQNYYFCLSRINNDTDEDSVFSLQVTHDSENDEYKYIYSPQINGYFYERYLEKGQLAFYTGLPCLDFKTELRYYLKKISGYPQMYFIKCHNYPNCNFKVDSLSDAIKPDEVNDMFSFSIFKTESTTLISPEQYVLLVYCNGDLPCQFQTNFYSELDKIVLQKDQRTYHTIMYKGENNFIIKLDGEKNYEKIFVNFLTYTGDISINAVGDGFRIRDYLAGNKKYFTIDSNTTTNTNKEIYFYIKGELASFYSVDYKLIFSDDDKIKMSEESGINYLETIEPKVGKKIISLTNKRLTEERNFTANFFSINCQIDVTRNVNNKTTDIETFDFLTQDVISVSDEDFNNPYYDYIMKIEKMDNVTQFDMNWCMVYVSSIEQNMDDEPEYKKRFLLISESVINRVILSDKMPSIEYIYPHINPEGYVAMNFNWQTYSKVTIFIYIGNKSYKNITTTHSQYLIITEKEVRSNNYCPYYATQPNQVCSIIVKIKLDSNNYQDEPIIEFNIKSKEIVPAFIRKSMLRKDIVVGNYHQYFYTEVGINETGNINIKFDRGSGKVYGRIVAKNENEGAGWMNRIILPEKNNEDLLYNYFTKKLTYGTYETENCAVGCFLLLKVEPNFSDEYYLSENIAYPITLSIDANDATIEDPSQDNITIVDIPLNEYIVGDTVPLSGRFNYFYSLFIPYDCKELIIEFLCESSYIYINVGNKKPTLEEADFSYKVMDTDGVLKITKQEILNKTKDINTIKNVQLTIAIGSQYFDDDSSSVYSFRITALRENDNNYIRLTSDQETLCNIVGKEDSCVFIIPQIRILDEQNNIFFHAVYLPNVEFKYYAREYPKDINTDILLSENKHLLPTRTNNVWSSDNSRGNYLYIDHTEIQDKENNYIALSLEVKSPDSEDDEELTITLLHTLFSYKGNILPNPSSAQLFIVNNNNLNELFFNFEENNRNLLFRIKTVSGNGIVYWDKSDGLNLNSEDENEYFYLNHPGDSVTLTIGNGVKDKFPLHFKNANPNKGKNDSNEAPGFGFYVFYEREASYENYNYIDFGENSLYNFKNTGFPFIFYSMINDKEHTIDLNIKLLSLKRKYSSSTNNNEQSEDTFSEIPSHDDFHIKGMLLDESTVYQRHVLPDIQPEEEDMFDGEYDSIHKLFKIQFTPEKMKQYNIEGNNYIYINIYQGATNDIEYSESTMDISVLPSNEVGYIAEMNKYIYGKIPYGQNGYIRYELSRIKSIFKFMRIEFSSNYDSIAYTLNSYKIGDNISSIDFYQSNIQFSENKYNGKSVIIIEFTDDEISSIFLSVFNNNNVDHINNEKFLSNFIFKYNIKEKNDFINIKPKEENLARIYKHSTLTINLTKFDSLPDGAKVNYLVELLPSKNKIENENLNSLAKIESNIIKIYRKTQINMDKNEMQIFDLHNDSVYYALISCEVVLNNYSELFSFKYFENVTNYENEESEPEHEPEPAEKSHTVLIVLLSLVGGFILIAAVIIFVCLYLKKSNLMTSGRLKELTKQINESGELPDVA